MTILANIAVPWLWQYEKIAFITICPAMLAEWLILRRMARLNYLRALYIAFVMNLASTIVGYPVAVLLQGPMNVADIGTIVFLGLAVACIITILVEWAVLRAFADCTAHALRYSIVCNLASYTIILGMLYGGYAMF